MTSADALRELETAGTEQNRKVYRRHGVRNDQFGVSFANLRRIAKQAGTDQPLADALWTTGNNDARILATLVADAATIVMGMGMGVSSARLRAISEMRESVPPVRAGATNGRVVMFTGPGFECVPRSGSFTPGPAARVSAMASRLQSDQKMTDTGSQRRAPTGRLDAHLGVVPIECLHERAAIR